MTDDKPDRKENPVVATVSALRAVPSAATDDSPDLNELLTRAGRGDEHAFGAVYDALGGSVYGMAKRVIRDPARAEEVSQEVFIQVWQSAARFDAARGNAKSWVLTLAHRRAVDAVRHDQAATNRENKYDWSSGPDFDEVAETVTISVLRK